MRILTTILCMSFVFSGELEVEGDLKVTGTIENDSLQQVIADLQSQISFLESQINYMVSQLGYSVDCNGVVGGSSQLDCAGVCDGLSVYDGCGICGGDESSCDLGPVLVDIDGNEYPTVYIDGTLWMARNLMTTHYNNGAEIPQIIEYNSYEWENASFGAYSQYSNPEIYGWLYNWFTTEDDQVCPEGWHIPTLDEWENLIEYLGGESIAGGKLKSLGTINDSTGFWYSPNTGATNEVGFFANPGGYRNIEGNSGYLGIHAFFWISESVNSTSSNASRSRVGIGVE